MEKKAFDGVAYHASRISPHRGKTIEGYLIATGVPIARTGWQTYKASELGLEGDGDKLVQVYRDAKDVFDPVTISSFEGKTITSPHPGMFLSPDNDNAYNRGHVQNVRRGDRLPDGEYSLIADLHFKDANLISQIESGQIDEVSCGYKYALEEIPDEHSPEVKYAMRKLLGNHVAIVPRGRAGSDVRVLDANPHDKGGSMKEEFEAIGKFFKDLGLRLVNDAEPDPVKHGREAAEKGEERSMKRNEDAEAELAKLKAKDAEEEKEKEKKESEDRKARDARMDKTLDCMDKFQKDAAEKEEKKAKDAEEEKKEEAKKAADAEEEKKKAADAGKCTCGAEDGEPHDKDCPAYKAEDAELIPVEIMTGNEVPQNPIPGADKALDALRAIKSVVAASGDRKAIDNWNQAYRALKPVKGNDGKYARIANGTRKPEGVEGVMDNDSLAKAGAEFEQLAKQGFRKPAGSVEYKIAKEAN